MATLDELKSALRQATSKSCQRRPLSQTSYSDGFDILREGSSSYRDFIVPQLSELLVPIFYSRPYITALEVGPGPRSVLGSLPMSLRRKIRRYVAFEPNKRFSSELSAWDHHDKGMEDSWLPGLDNPPEIHHLLFRRASEALPVSNTSPGGNSAGFDIVLFCHSMYGMQSKRECIEQAIKVLKKAPGGIVIVFHRTGNLHFDGLVCHKIASFPTGTTCVANRDQVLDNFAPFIAGFDVQNETLDEGHRFQWREVCRNLGHRSTTSDSDLLLFSAPTTMVVFNQYATRLPELAAQVPLATALKKVKNPEARGHLPASIIKPTNIRHVQECVRWALRYDLSMTVLGGSHSGHCVWDYVVAIDLSAFNEMHIVRHDEHASELSRETEALIVVQSGCTAADIVHTTAKECITLPLGARPSVGAGLWLQGGIGHLSRTHGLTCDAIVGAVLVSVDSGQVLYVGFVPQQHRPIDAIRSSHEDELLWALKGAGTNFGIVISVVFKTCKAQTHFVRSWVNRPCSNSEAASKLHKLDKVSRRLPANHSIDAFLYHADGELRLGATLFKSSPTILSTDMDEPEATRLSEILGPCDDAKFVDSIGLFGEDLYVSVMHGGHGGGKTSSFKRCMFLQSIGTVEVVSALINAIEIRPSPLSYVHLLHGGGAISKVAADASAFACRNWKFACIITGVWARELDGTRSARDAVQWVYDVAAALRSSRSGVYSADLGPDPRDRALAIEAFGRNGRRLARLKHCLDPHRILPFTCPLPRRAEEPKLVLLITGDICAGKDYCASLWANKLSLAGFSTRVTSISDVTKREYASVSGASLDQLLQDRAYKEHHRPLLTAYYRQQIQQRPWLPEEHFLNAVHGALGMDALLVTGMRDEAPVASYWHLMPCSRLLDVRVTACEGVRKARGDRQSSAIANGQGSTDSHDNDTKSAAEAVSYTADLTFDNDTTGGTAAEHFADEFLLPLLHEDIQRLADMVRSVPDFPRAGVDFRHVLDISQQPGGLSLCTSLLQSHFVGNWSTVDAIACCESGGFVFGSALAAQVSIPLVVIREAGKIPPPRYSLPKPASHISAFVTDSVEDKTIAMGCDAIPRAGTVVVVDDVLSTGRTLCAMLQLLEKAGIRSESVTAMVVAEFPAHRGRECLRRNGFGNVRVKGLLVFDGT